MRLVRRPKPFDHPDWIYEIKCDGFRAFAYIDRGNCQIVSQRPNDARRFDALSASIAELRIDNAIIDGEIVCLGADGRSLFQALGREKTFESR
jgi:ATP-dependent DNA ligase